MKLTDIKFPHDTKDKFLYRVIFRGEDYTENQKSFNKAVRKIAHESTNVDEFIDKFLEEDGFKLTQAYAELIKRERPEEAWYYIRGMFGNRSKKTVSDAGGLKIGNGNFSIIIPNYSGDGYSRYAVVRKYEINTGIFNFFTSIEGEINIYSYDCGSEILETLTGRYGVYVYQGFILFEKW